MLTQGIQAQTIANLYLALEHNLEIIPVVNKIDMDAAKPEEVIEDIVHFIGCKKDEVLKVSAKTGEGVELILDAIVNRIPAPLGDSDAPLQALIFDSVFNSFRGIVAYFKILNGCIRTNDHLLNSLIPEKNTMLMK